MTGPPAGVTLTSGGGRDMDPRHIRVQASRTDWRGQLKREYREADRWYRAQLINLGLLKPEPEPPRPDVLTFDT